MVYISLIVHGLITVIAVTAIAVRVEHRLTVIENDTKWLKKWIGNCGCKNERDGEK